ncbi:MAG: hypothetical protein M3R68_03460, partial [Acidobacteriota bacterium]|nr:hypothetical protein [Acidobacteriota bacterium]
MNTDSPNYLNDAKQSIRVLLCLSLLLMGIISRTGAQSRAPRAASTDDVRLRLLRAEDERRWDSELETLLADRNTETRRRAALAAGRIGDDRAVPALIS